MVTLQIDLSDVLDETHDDDAVVVWPPTHREGSRGQVIAPRKRTIPLAGGQATVQVEPGPLNVQIRAQDGRVDGEVRRLIVPEEGPVTLRAMMEDSGAFTYTPEIMTAVTRMRADAVEAREGALASEVAAKTSETNAAGHATQAADDRRQTGEDRTQTGLDRQAAAQSATDAATSATTAEGHKNTVQTALAGARLYSGTGSPSGRVSAPVGSIYTDTSVTAGAVRWLKTSGTGNTGWIVEYGDTGWRDITASVELGRLSVGTGGYFRVRRTERFVEYAIKDMSVVSNGNLFSTPSGFRAETSQSVNVFNGSGFFQVSRFWLGISGAAGGQNLSLDREFIIRFSARSDEWPSTLPGTPT